MKKEDALKAVDRAFDNAVAHLFDVFMQGLAGGEGLDALILRASNGFTHALQTHRRMTDIVARCYPEQPSC